jgi:hypothetical protein
MKALNAEVPEHRRMPLRRQMPTMAAAAQRRTPITDCGLCEHAQPTAVLISLAVDLQGPMSAEVSNSFMQWTEGWLAVNVCCGHASGLKRGSRRKRAGLIKAPMDAGRDTAGERPLEGDGAQGQARPADQHRCHSSRQGRQQDERVRHARQH